MSITMYGCGSKIAKSPKVMADTLHQGNIGCKDRVAKSLRRKRNALKQLINGNILSQMAALRNARTH